MASYTVDKSRYMMNDDIYIYVELILILLSADPIKTPPFKIHWSKLACCVV